MVLLNWRSSWEGGFYFHFHHLGRTGAFTAALHDSHAPAAAIFSSTISTESMNERERMGLLAGEHW